MEAYLQISYLNDFIFCPLSIYFHQLYGSLSERLYYTDYQFNGKAAHAAIDEKRYSTHASILQGMDIYSDKYKLCGKIDIFNAETGLLTERKKHIAKIYDGYLFQLYAQYFCLQEMGYDVKKIRFYSSDDNKIHSVLLPNEDEEIFAKFEQTITEMQSFNVDEYFPVNENKCLQCIYSNFCDRALSN